MNHTEAIYVAVAIVALLGAALVVWLDRPRGQR